MQKRKTYPHTKFPDRTIVEAMHVLSHYWPRAERDDVMASRSVVRGFEEREFNRDAQFLVNYRSDDVDGAYFSKWDSRYGLKVDYNGERTIVTVSGHDAEEVDRVLAVFDRVANGVRAR